MREEVSDSAPMMSPTAGDVTRDDGWSAPARYSEARRVDPALTVVIDADEEWVDGELLLWLRHADLGWYGYCTWSRRRVAHHEPVPAERLRVVRSRPVSVYDDGEWRRGTLRGWRQHRNRGWEASVQLRGAPDPRWLPANRVHPA